MEVEGVAMGSTVSLIIANMYTEQLEEKALRILQNHPRLWRRYVDDTFVIQQTEYKENFLGHINSID